MSSPVVLWFRVHRRGVSFFFSESPAASGWVRMLEYEGPDYRRDRCRWVPDLSTENIAAIPPYYYDLIMRAGSSGAAKSDREDSLYCPLAAVVNGSRQTPTQFYILFDHFVLTVRINV
uniref:(northern house mosquito) hypothetical protein n=1 Tax=Culex pipiens TaxID=7175 RepID=A0A8D8CDF4_CULPI